MAGNLQGHRSLSLLLVLVLTGSFLAGCTTPTARDGPLDGGFDTQAVQGGAGSSGGQVGDVAPVFRAFTGTLTAADNSGAFSEVHSGTLFDGNGEKDLRNAVITVRLVHPGGTFTFTHTITNTETDADTEPATYGTDNFRVWSATKNDGQLLFKHRYAYALGTPPGTYTFSATITPSGGTAVANPAGGDLTTAVATFKLITVDAPVALAGTPTASATWGQWTALPGQRNVESANFVKITNSGQDAAAQVFVDFTENAFNGPDTDTPIAVPGNVQFAWCEVASPSTPPSGCTFSDWSSSSLRGLTLQFTGLGKTMYVKYRIVAVPDVVVRQAYGASYTVTEL